MGWIDDEENKFTEKYKKSLRNTKQISQRNTNKLHIPAFSSEKLKNRQQWGESMVEPLKVCRWLDEKWPLESLLPKYIWPKLINPRNISGLIYSRRWNFKIFPSPLLWSMFALPCIVECGLISPPYDEAISQTCPWTLRESPVKSKDVQLSKHFGKVPP